MRMLCIAVLALLAMGCEGPAAGTGTPKVALIDQNKVFMQSSAGAKGMQMLQDLSKKLQDELKAMQGEGQPGDPSSPGAGAKDEKEQQAFQEKLAGFQATMGEEQQRIVNLLTENFNQVLEEYRAKHGIAVVLPLEVAVAFEKSADITEAIVAAMNARNISIDPVLPATPAVPAAPAAPEAKPGEAPQVPQAPQTK